MADVYERRIAPLRASDALRGADARAFGSEVGEALRQGGGELVRHELAMERIEAEAERIEAVYVRAEERSRRSVDLIDHETDLAPEIEALRNADPTGIQGSGAAIDALVSERNAQFLEGIADPDLRQEFAPRLGAMAAKFRRETQGYNVVARVHEAKNNFVTVRDGLALAVYNDPASAQSAGEVLTALVDGDPRFDAPTKALLHREWKPLLARQAIQGTGKTNPEAARAMIEQGTFAAWLDPDDAPALDRSMGAEIRRRENERQEAANQQIAQVREHIELAKTRQANGEVLPDEDLAALQEAAAGAGLDKQEYEIGAARIRNNLNRETASWRPAKWDQEINALRAKGEKRSPDEAVKLAHLEARREKAVREYNDDPAGFAAANGIVEPDLNIDDPKSVAAHNVWARGVGRATGRPGPFVPRQLVPQIAEMVAGTPAQRQQAAETLMQLREPDAIRGAAEQVAKHDEPFKIMMRLSTLPNAQVAQRRMRQIQEGPAALLQNKAVWDEDAARAEFMTYARPALAHMGAEFAEGVFQTAKNIYATIETRGGNSKWRGDGFRYAIQLAVGAMPEAGDTGGIQRWGGEDGPTVVVPVGWTDEHLEATIWGADEADFMRGSKGRTPVLNGGAPIRLSQVKRMTPVALREGVYGFWTGSGFLPAKEGGPWLIDVRLMTRRRPR